MRLPVRLNLREFIRQGVKLRPLYASNGNMNSLGFTLGVNFAALQMTAEADTPEERGTYYGSAIDLLGKTFIANNGVIMGVDSLVDENTFTFITNANEADLRAGYEYPNIWLPSNVVVTNWDDSLTWEDSQTWGDYIGPHQGI